MRSATLFIMLGLFGLLPVTSADVRPPVLDMHVHAFSASANGPLPAGFCAPYLEHMLPFDGSKTVAEHWAEFFADPPCDEPIWAPETDAALMEQTLKTMERLNIIGVVGSSETQRVNRWHKAMPERVIKATSFIVEGRFVDVDRFAELFTEQGFSVMAEIAPQYAGISPLDPRLADYWALAEELQIPIGFHMIDGLPGINQTFAPEHRIVHGNPMLLEEILVKHPRLRLFVMHYGAPFVDEMIAIMTVFPQVYVELGGVQWVYPKAYFYQQLQQFVDAGFGKRVMFGSDAMNWPGLIDYSLALVEDAPSLSDEQKRDILYNNAARFLRLTEAEIAAHHGK